MGGEEAKEGEGGEEGGAGRGGLGVGVVVELHHGGVHLKRGGERGREGGSGAWVCCYCLVLQALGDIQILVDFLTLITPNP